MISVPVVETLFARSLAVCGVYAVLLTTGWTGFEVTREWKSVNLGDEGRRAKMNRKNTEKHSTPH